MSTIAKSTPAFACPFACPCPCPYRSPPSVSVASSSKVYSASFSSSLSSSLSSSFSFSSSFLSRHGLSSRNRPLTSSSRSRIPLTRPRCSTSVNINPDSTPPSSSSPSTVPAIPPLNSLSDAIPLATRAPTVQHLRLLRRDWYVPGRLLLLLVPVLWGGYTVSIRLLYDLPWALSPSVFNSVRLFFASVIVLPGLLTYLKSKESPSVAGTPASKRVALWGGFEIGVWTFVVNVLQILGLKFSTAARGAFLNQLSSIIVPFAAFACGMEPTLGLPVFLASVLSILGVALFSLDDIASPFTWLGEGVLILSAFAGTAFMLRSKQYSSHPDAFVVIALKIITQFICSLFFVLPAIFKHFVRFTSPLAGFRALFIGATPFLVVANLLLVLYNGVLISWLSTVFHIKGQEAVSASEAVVIFASTPIWSALMAIPFGERFGLRGVIGAAMIVVSTMLASVKRKPKKG